MRSWRKFVKKGVLFSFYNLITAKRYLLIYMLQISFKIPSNFDQSSTEITDSLPEKLHPLLCVFQLKTRWILVENPVFLTKVVDKNWTWVFYSHKFLVSRRVFEIIKPDPSLQRFNKDTFFNFVKFFDHRAGWSNDDFLFSTIRLFWHFGGMCCLDTQGNSGSGGTFYVHMALLFVVPVLFLDVATSEQIW